MAALVHVHDSILPFPSPMTKTPMGIPVMKNLPLPLKTTIMMKATLITSNGSVGGENQKKKGWYLQHGQNEEEQHWISDDISKRWR